MARNQSPLETPKTRQIFRAPSLNQEAVGRISERFARAMGTGAFLITMTIIVLVWISWNTLAPVSAQYDPRALNSFSSGFLCGTADSAGSESSGRSRPGQV